MLEIRFHGRGGQGAVTAAELLSVAAFHDGKFAQAFPSFGAERMGAPVQAYCRISDQPIRTREPVASPGVVVVQDPTLLVAEDVLFGLTGDGILLVNTARDAAHIAWGESKPRLAASHVIALPASEIAERHTHRPIPNVALLGAVLALTGAAAMASLERALRERFPPKIADANTAAAAEAFAQIRSVPC
jgi:pyruvate ferredoxin oxidoreductase gamma subunit